MRRLKWTGWFGGFLSVAVLIFIASPLLSGAGTSEAGEEEGDSPDQSHHSEDTAVAAVDDPTEEVSDSSDEDRTPEVAEECDRSPEVLDEARRLVHYRRLDDADEFLAELLDRDCIEAPEDRDVARFQHAYVSHRLDRPQAVLDRLERLETDPPIGDYVSWLKGKSLHTLDRPGEAAEAFGSIYDADDSRLHWKARARQAKSLADAERWDEALPVLDELIELFPDYPRRHRALYLRGRALEQLDRPDDAAEAYQQANFEFPHKAEGESAAERLDALAERGFVPDPIDPEKRYEKYRQLSVDKFWPLAHELMTDLRDELADGDEPSRLENQLLQRIALNTYHSHDFEGAAEYFAEARRLYEQGHTRGFSKRTIYRYHNFALARIGRMDEARQALEKLHEHSTRNRRRALARFYERWGQYERAYELYGNLYSSAQKRRWHYTYLKYKTGRFDEARENLERLARRSRGQTKAKYLYWAGRAMERAGDDDSAAEFFARTHRIHPTSYYGIQSQNRMIDLQQRSTVDDTMLVHAMGIDDQADSIFDAFDGADVLRTATEPAAYDPDPRARPVGQQLFDRPTSPGRTADGDDSCGLGAQCPPSGLGLPFPTYGVNWNLGQPLVDALPAERDGDVPAGEPIAAAYDGVGDAIPAGDGFDSPHTESIASRVHFNTDGRIYWHGRHRSDIAFANYLQGDMIGPVPDEWTAYTDDTHRGGLERAIDEAGELFPRLQRVHWLWMAGWYTEARREIREVTLEFRSLTNQRRPSSSPRELSHNRWEYLIDNRRRSSRADLWGMDDDEPRFPVPDDSDARRALLERQQEIHDRRGELRDVIVEALQEVGDYHFVRQFALDRSFWLRQSPEGEALRHWQMAYPRAFPEQVIPLAEKHNVNPYMIWALMLVESSFNPDSISIADALGLLQVIPRTGYKIADLFGADDFGPFDLLEADNSIEQGIFYFSKLVRKFHGQELFAFAGYNGGPHRVSGWLDMRGQNIPIDEFVEEIPFDESRGYAKKVLRFLHLYLRIYEGYDDGLYVGQNVRADYLEQPDF